MTRRRRATDPIKHFDERGAPFCGARGGQVVSNEEETTCQRCLKQLDAYVAEHATCSLKGR